MERARGSKTPCALSLPLPPHTSAGSPLTCVFVTVNEARRYLATSADVTVYDYRRQISKPNMVQPSLFSQFPLSQCVIITHPPPMALLKQPNNLNEILQLFIYRSSELMFV
jgi:hypothetical protein